jgi:hypothetical protein
MGLDIVRTFLCANYIINVNMRQRLENLFKFRKKILGNIFSVLGQCALPALRVLSANKTS